MSFTPEVTKISARPNLGVIHPPPLTHLPLVS